MTYLSYNSFPYRQDQTYLETLLGDTYELTDIWTGLNDRQSRGVYRWSDTGPVRYTNWYNNQPDDSSRMSSCVKMSLQQSYRGGLSWTDDDCSMKHAFVCMRLRSKLFDFFLVLLLSRFSMSFNVLYRKRKCHENVVIYFYGINVSKFCQSSSSTLG